MQQTPKVPFFNYYFFLQFYKLCGAQNPSHLPADGVNYSASWFAGHLLLRLQLHHLHPSSLVVCG